MRAISARTSASATSAKCWPSSAISSTATGTCHGAGVDFSDLCSGICKSLGVRKGDLATNEGALLLGIEFSPQRRAHNAQDGPLCRRCRPSGRYCVPALSQRPARSAASSAAEIGGLPAIKGLGESAACAWVRQGRRRPSPADCRRDRGKTCRKAAARGCLPAAVLRAGQPAQQQNQMQHNQIESALDRVGNSVIGVKGRQSCLRHDHAIERGDGAALGDLAETAAGSWG